jgi:hypothetical protein
MTQRYRSQFVGFVGALIFTVQLPLGSAKAAPPDDGAATNPAADEPSADEPSADEATPSNGYQGPIEPIPSDSSGGPSEAAEAEPTPAEPTPDDPPATTPAPKSDKTDDEDTAPTPSMRPRHSLIYNHTLGLRYNPLGLSSELNIGYRYQLINKDTVLFRDSFIAAQAHTVVTPAYVGAGPRLDIQPAAVLNLSATYDYIGFFGAFGSLQSFPSANAEWHEDVISDLADMDLNYGAGGHQITLSALLQGKFKSIAFRNNPKFYWYDFDLRNGDRTYYSQTIDMLVPDRGWAMTNDLDLLYLFDFGLTLGARYTVTHAFYRDEHFAPGEEKNNINGPTHRIGPAVIYTFFNRPDQRFNQPSLVLLAQWWAKHRYRTGQEVSGAIPYFVLAFTFKGTILPHPATWNPKSERKKKKRKRAR